MRSVEVYIKDNQDVWTRLDLFDYETIDITNSIQDIKEIGKVFTDFSKEFDVPASNTNNKVFKHITIPYIRNNDYTASGFGLHNSDGTWTYVTDPSPTAT